MVFNICGIYCCLKQNTRLKKQKIILLNLSSMEILIIIRHLCFGHINTQLEKESNRIKCTLYHGLTSLQYSSMLLISAERLLYILTPSYYQSNIQVSTLKRTICMIWMLSILWPIPFTFCDMDVHVQVIRYFSYVMQVLFVSVSALMFVLVAHSLHVL